MEQIVKQKLLKLIILLIVSKIKISNCEINLIPCSMTDNNCTISGVTLSLKNYTFKPVASRPKFVISLEIKRSTVPVITSEICSTLPNLKTFTAIQQGIQVIEDYAFNNCTELTLISLPFNNIHELGKGIFDNTKKLQEINMHGGSLERIDVNLFDNLGELIELVISGNKLKELPIQAIKNLKKLKILYLYSNELDDLDANGLTESLPNLKAVYINDNNFHCDRLNEIIAIFNSKYILIIDHTHSVYLKKRDYIPHKVENIICLSKSELDSEKMKKALNDSLDKLKEYPIGKEVIQLKDIVSSGFAEADSSIVTLFNQLNETSENLNQQISNIYQTLNATTTKIQEMLLSINSMMDMYKGLVDTVSSTPKNKENNNLAILVLLIALLLVVGLLIIFLVYKRLRSTDFHLPFTYHKNDSIHLIEEQEQKLNTVELKI